MKIQYKHLLFLALSVVILSGCSRGQQETGVMEQPSEPAQVSQVDEGVPPEATEPESQVAPDVNPLDRYDKDLDCSDLRDEDAELNCEIQVQDVVTNALYSEIRAGFDIGRCDELPTAYMETCQTTLTETGVTGPVSEEERDLFNEIVRGTRPEVDDTEGATAPGGLNLVYDPSQCAQLSTQGYREYCEAQIQQRIDQNLLDEIIRSGDSSRCEELSDEGDMFQCQRSFGIVSEEPPPVPLEGAPVEAPEVEG